jgi:hypothetical protein
MTKFHEVRVPGSEQATDASPGMSQGKALPLTSAEWWGIRRHLDELSSLRGSARLRPDDPMPTNRPVSKSVL